MWQQSNVFFSEGVGESVGRRSVVIWLEVGMLDNDPGNVVNRVYGSGVGIQTKLSARIVGRHHS